MAGKHGWIDRKAASEKAAQEFVSSVETWMTGHTEPDAQFEVAKTLEADCRKTFPEFHHSIEELSGRAFDSVSRMALKIVLDTKGWTWAAKRIHYGGEWYDVPVETVTLSRMLGQEAEPAAEPVAALTYGEAKPKKERKHRTRKAAAKPEPDFEALVAKYTEIRDNDGWAVLEATAKANHPKQAEAILSALKPLEAVLPAAEVQEQDPVATAVFEEAVQAADATLDAVLEEIRETKDQTATAAEDAAVHTDVCRHCRQSEAVGTFKGKKWTTKGLMPYRGRLCRSCSEDINVFMVSAVA